MICRRDGQTEVLSVKISSVEEDLKWNWRWRALIYFFNDWKTEIIDECIIIHSDGFFINKNMYPGPGLIWNAPKSRWKMYFHLRQYSYFLNAPKMEDFNFRLIFQFKTTSHSEYTSFTYFLRHFILPRVVTDSFRYFAFNLSSRSFPNISTWLE